MKLETKDYELLQYIADNPGLTYKDIRLALKGTVNGVVYRLESLSQTQADPCSPVEIPFGKLPSKKIEDYFIYCEDGKYYLSSKGHAKLQDWIIRQKLEKHKVLESRFWHAAPYIVSFSALLKSFWPEITSIWQSLKP